MPNRSTRRDLLRTVAGASLAGLAGCTASVPAPDRARAILARPEPPDESFPEAARTRVYEPGTLVDVAHRRLYGVRVGDLAARKGQSNGADGTLLGWEAKVREGFELDPASVDILVRYTPATVVTGDFSRDDVAASFEADGWRPRETDVDVELYEHGDYPDIYAAGIGDGWFVSARRFRTIHPAEFVRAHAAAGDGPGRRYADRDAMGALLDVVGGGHRVAAITHGPEDGAGAPPGTIAQGQSWHFGADVAVRTDAFAFGPDAPDDPAALVKRSLGGETPPEYVRAHRVGSRANVGYLCIAFANDAFPPAAEFRKSADRGDDTASVQSRLDRAYRREHGGDPPEATFAFSYEAEATDADCGAPERGVGVLTYEDGPPIPVRHLLAGTRARPFSLSACDRFEIADELEPGDSVRIGVGESAGKRFIVLWGGPNGGLGQLGAWRLDESRSSASPTPTPARMNSV